MTKPHTFRSTVFDGLATRSLRLSVLDEPRMIVSDYAAGAQPISYAVEISAVLRGRGVPEEIAGMYCYRILCHGLDNERLIEHAYGYHTTAEDAHHEGSLEAAMIFRWPADIPKNYSPQERDALIEFRLIPHGKEPALLPVRGSTSRVGVFPSDPRPSPRILRQWASRPGAQRRIGSEGTP